MLKLISFNIYKFPHLRRIELMWRSILTSSKFDSKEIVDLVRSQRERWPLAYHHFFDECMHTRVVYVPK